MSAAPTDASSGDLAFALLQRLLPTRALSTCVSRLTRIRHRGFKNTLIQLFLKSYQVNLAEAESPDATAYVSFNAFFTRALRVGARPLPADRSALVSPCDGTVSQYGGIRTDGRIFQAKGHDYSAAELLGAADLAAAFEGGDFCTIYLAPHNYHRLHMPMAGTLREWLYIPGRLFSVNPATTRALPRLFARNERVAAIFDTEHGPLAMVLVGALFVGSIETVWAGQISPPHRRRCGVIRQRPTTPIHLQRAEEMGRFNMGSTIVMLTAPGACDWLGEALSPGTPLQMGQPLGHCRA